MLKPIKPALGFLLLLILVGCKTETRRATEKPVPHAVAVAAAAPAVTNGEIRVAHIFSDNMVLQQNATVPIWGWAADGQSVTVSFRGEKASATARNGHWLVKLRGLKAGGPDVLTISGGSNGPVQLTNVLVGEVWLASGQSNMEWPLHKAFQSEHDIATATNTMIRWFSVPNVKADAPMADVAGNWLVTSPQNAPGFSAVAYYFARDLQQERGVPIGIIQSDWGGSPAEVWMSHEALAANPRYRKEILDAYAQGEQAYMDALMVYYKERAEARKTDKPFTKRVPTRGWKPTELYNAMIAPLVPYAIKGAIWYQGESNAARAEQYRSLFPDMIRDWRHDWGYDFPFLCVQLAPFKPIQPQPGDSDWAELREAQLLTTKALPKVGMAVITDVGDERDIHPTKKVPVGGRLALAARAIAYGEKIDYSGPIFKSVNFREGRAFLTFDHADGGLVTRGEVMKGFSICGPDHKFIWALAQIMPDNTVSVWSPNVPDPVAVRYGWADFPVVNLWNRAGLPASPFRTDDFPMLTAGKK